MSIGPKESYEHHLQVLSRAIRGAVKKTVCPHLIRLYNLSLSHHSWEKPNLHHLSQSLYKLVKHVETLCLMNSHSALQLLPWKLRNLRQLDIYDTSISRASLETFLKAHAQSIHSIGIHDVWLTENGLRDCGLSPDFLPDMLKVPQAYLERMMSDRTYLTRKTGWRLVLQCDNNGDSSSVPAKRKIADTGAWA